MSKVEEMFKVDDIKVASLFVRNILTVEMRHNYPGLLDELKEGVKEEVCTIEFTASEWNSLNLVTWFIYELLCRKCDETKSIIEKSSLEKFLDSFESVATKINDAEFIIPL